MAPDKVIGKVFRELDVGRPDMNEFRDRMRYQHIIYMLQNSGISLSYGFKWYMKNPYCSELSGVLYAIFKNMRTYDRSVNITFRKHKQVMQIIKEFKEKLGDSINDYHYLDALACMHYINMSRFSGKGTFEEVRDWYLDIKPRFEDYPHGKELLQRAYDDLKKYKGLE